MRLKADVFRTMCENVQTQQVPIPIFNQKNNNDASDFAPTVDVRLIYKIYRVITLSTKT